MLIIIEKLVNDKELFDKIKLEAAFDENSEYFTKVEEMVNFYKIQDQTI